MCPEDGLYKHEENDLKHQQESVVAQLLWVRREVIAVIPADVCINAAALAPPLIAVSSQTWKNR